MLKDNYLLSFKPVVTSNIPDHDPSAVISKNGKIIAGVEEERLVRIKHARGFFPVRSIAFCLKKAMIKFADINRIIIPEDPDHFRKNFYSLKILKRLRYKLALKRENREELTIPNLLSYYLSNRKKSRRQILMYLKHFFGDQKYPEIDFLDHHLCHAASCLYPSGFNNASILTIDGEGDFDSTVIWNWNGENIEREISWKIDNSLGYFYGAFTIFLGYRIFNGETKIMGLAPYGEKNTDILNVFEEIIKTSLDGYDVSEITIPMLFGRSVVIRRIEDLFGVKRRIPNERFSKEHKDLAYAVQYYLEKIGTNLVKQTIEITGNHNVCLSGGVALNCKMNKKIMELPEVKRVFIQPVAHDAGLALGAVLEASKKNGHNVLFKMTHNYFGPEYTDSSIIRILEDQKNNFSKIKNLRMIAHALADGKFVGWFQGRMEMGPRALGNRSILLDPRRNDLKDSLNEFVKHREKWRPYAPSILEDFADEIIENYNFAPFMIKTFDVNKKYRKDIEAVLHPTDKTTRPHVVYKDANPRYYNLIKEFWKITGVPLVLNTSFNDHGEPIVCSPQDALKTFNGTGLDLLVLEDYIIQKVDSF
jgi:carbamoyltransferase